MGMVSISNFGFFSTEGSKSDTVLLTREGEIIKEKSEYVNMVYEADIEIILSKRVSG